LNAPAEWIGERPTALQLGVILLVGVCGVMIAGLQPLLLGTLAQEGRITAAQLGHAATAELLLMGAASAYAGARWKAERLRSIGVINALVLAALNIATVWASGETVTLIRALAGVPSGVLIWITIAMIARSATPERWSGIYLTVQTLAQFVLAAALTAWVISRTGANGGFIALAVLCIISALAALALPNRFAPLVADSTASNMPNARGFVALAATFLWMAFIVGVWVYAEPLSRQSGHAPTVAGVAVSLSLACQVLGGTVATLLAGRLRWFPTVMLCALIYAACLLAFAALPSESLYLVTSAVFGFLWMFSLPFFVPMVIAADPTRRAALLIGGAELTGGSLGPLFASFVVSDADVRGSLGFGALALAVTVAIAFALHRRERALPVTIAET
jgi:predicted MFS family arabinose efflux permease